MVRYEALRSFESTQEARVARGVAKSNSYASFVLSINSRPWTYTDVWTNFQFNHTNYYLFQFTKSYFVLFLMEDGENNRVYLYRNGQLPSLKHAWVHNSLALETEMRKSSLLSGHW